MKKIVNVEVPALNENYDILVPEILRVHEVTELIAEAVASFSNGRYCPSKQELLCLKERNILLVQNATLGDYGIKNGEHLVLI